MQWHGSNSPVNSWTDTPRIRVLAVAFASVPGISPHAAALLALRDALRAELDVVTVKTDQLSHVERFGSGRMFRVPTGEGALEEQREVFERAFGRQLEAEAYDVVHAFGPFEAALAAERRTSLGFRLVYEVMSFPEALDGRGVKEWSDAHRQAVRTADLVLVSNEIAERAVRAEGASIVRILGPAVDIGRFDAVPVREAALPRILYVGSFEADRNMPLLLSALKRVRKTRDFRALLAGERAAERRSKVQRWIHSEGLSGVVDVRGEPAPDTYPRLIAGASVCVTTAGDAPRFSRYGDVPQPLLEYLACRRPVVAPAVPGVVSVLRDEQEALLYPPNRDNALADAILEILRDGELRERLAARGHERVRSTFTAGARRRHLAEIYERLIPGSQLGDPWRECFQDEFEPEVITAMDANPELRTDPQAAPGAPPSRIRNAHEALEPATIEPASPPRSGSDGRPPVRQPSPLSPAASTLSPQRIDTPSTEPQEHDGASDDSMFATPIPSGDTDPGT